MLNPVVPVARVAVLAAALFVAGCAVSQVPQLDDRPRVLRVEGSGVYRWEPDSGWVQPASGGWGPSRALRVEARKAFDAGAWAYALAGFLILQERRTRAADASKDLNFYTAECYYRLGYYADALAYYRPVYRRDFPLPNMGRLNFQSGHGPPPK